jgi:ABC-type glycerol-3-phosphate transport system permease component
MLHNPPLMFQKPIWESFINYTNYSYVVSFRQYNAGGHLLNSAVITSLTIVMTLVISSLFAYSLVFIRIPWKKFFFILALSTMMVPMNALIVSIFKVYIDLHILNSWTGLILQSSLSGFGVFLLRQYFIRIPAAFIESARMDGAGHLQIWWHIILPMSRPALAALAIIQFRIVWNDFLIPVVVLRDNALMTLPALLYLIGGSGPGLATGLIAIIIPLILFIRFHRQFIEGFTGGLKS